MELSIRMVVIAAVAILSVALIVFILTSQTGMFEDILNENREEARDDLFSIWEDEEGSEQREGEGGNGEQDNDVGSGDGDNGGENGDNGGS